MTKHLRRYIEFRTSGQGQLRAAPQPVRVELGGGQSNDSLSCLASGTCEAAAPRQPAHQPRFHLDISLPPRPRRSEQPPQTTNWPAVTLASISSPRTEPHREILTARSPPRDLPLRRPGYIAKRWSGLHHVQEQLRQRHGHLVRCAPSRRALACTLFGCWLTPPGQLAPGPHFPDRICRRVGQARVCRRRPDEQDARRPLRNQGTFPSVLFSPLRLLSQLTHPPAPSATPRSSRRTKRSSSPSTSTSVSALPASPRTPASSPTS